MQVDRTPDFTTIPDVPFTLFCQFSEKEIGRSKVGLTNRSLMDDPTNVIVRS